MICLKPCVQIKKRMFKNILLKIENNSFKGLKPKTEGQVTTGKIGTKGVNPNPRCIKKSKFITQNKWAMHLFNLSILIMQSCMRLNNGFTHWNVRRLEFLLESKSFIKSKSLRTIAHWSRWSKSVQKITAPSKWNVN